MVMKILKQTVAAKTCTLKANWTIDRSADNSFTIGDDTWQEVGAALRKEIDEEIVNNIRRHELMLKGWVKAPFTSDKFATPGNHQIAEVTAWIHMNTTAQYQIFGREFWFSSKEDLTLFVLRWA
jgi:hypothetical protein